MLIAFVRLGFVAATLAASIHLGAATLVWTLTDVRFSDGTVATGYLSYDDTTGTLSSWNVRLSAAPWPFMPHSHVPANSMGYRRLSTPPYDLYFRPFAQSPAGFWRPLVIAPVAPLDGNSSVVSIDVTRSRDFFEDESSLAHQSRRIIAGSLALTAAPPPDTIVQVEEFYNPTLRHFFITADAAEKRTLDTGAYGNWIRTGESFNAYAAGSSAGGSISPVCRFYSPPLIEVDFGYFANGTNSHFLSADDRECEIVIWLLPVTWNLESENVFQINLPDTATGACPGGTIPVYRLLNVRDSNHRYTTSLAIRTQMLAAGAIAEGYGPDGVAMCAVQ